MYCCSSYTRVAKSDNYDALAGAPPAILLFSPHVRSVVSLVYALPPVYGESNATHKDDKLGPGNKSVNVRNQRPKGCTCLKNNFQMLRLILVKHSGLQAPSSFLSAMHFIL